MGVSPEAAPTPQFQPNPVTELALKARDLLRKSQLSEPESDEAARALNEARNTFEEVVARTESTLLNTLRRIENNWTSAQDIVQETYLRAYNYLPAFHLQNSQFETWLYRIMLNCRADHYKRQVRDRKLLEPRHGKPPEFITSVNPHPDPEAAVLQDELRKEILKELEELTPEQREVMFLHYFGDYSYIEISNMLDRGLNGSKALAFRGLRRLRRNKGLEND